MEALHEEYNAEGRGADEKEASDTHSFCCHQFENTVQLLCKEEVDHDHPAGKDCEDRDEEAENSLPGDPECIFVRDIAPVTVEFFLVLFTCVIQP